MKKSVLVLAIVGLLALMGIVLATSTMNPRITYTGIGLPDPSVGRVGDLYIDLNANILYVRGVSGWGVLAVLPTPVNGTNGLNGATWIVGNIDPTSDLGSNGDLYFNCATLDIFYKADGIWSLLANIAPRQGSVGPQGPQGETGPQGPAGKDGRNGSVWYNELVAQMTVDLGFDGDYYMLTNGTVYYKMNGVWVHFLTLTGPQGPQGETGATGATGAIGPQGIAGVNALNGAEGSTGAKGADAPWWLYIILSAIIGGAVGSGTVIVAKRKDQKQQQ